jgi:hypothetical protein
VGASMKFKQKAINLIGNKIENYRGRDPNLTATFGGVLVAFGAAAFAVTHDPLAAEVPMSIAAVLFIGAYEDAAKRNSSGPQSKTPEYGL